MLVWLPLFCVCVNWVLQALEAEKAFAADAEQLPPAATFADHKDDTMMDVLQCMSCLYCPPYRADPVDSVA